MIIKSHDASLHFKPLFCFITPLFSVAKPLYNYKCSSVHQVKGKSRFSRQIMFDFSMQIPLIYEHIYSINILSVGLLVRLQKVEMYIFKYQFLGYYIRQGSNSFFVKIHLINGHLFYEYFVRLSVSQATNDIHVKILYNR